GPSARPCTRRCQQDWQPGCRTLRPPRGYRVPSRGRGCSMPRGEPEQMRPRAIPSALLLHERHCLLGQRQPALARCWREDEPFAHRLAFPGVEVRALTLLDELVDALTWKLQQALAPYEHREDPPADLELP